jgi:hypothetical protein
VPLGKQAQKRNVVVCHLSVGRCEYAFRSTPASGSPARCAPLPKPRISACSTFNSPKPTAGPFKLPRQVAQLPIESAEECLSSLSGEERVTPSESRKCASSRRKISRWQPMGRRRAASPAGARPDDIPYPRANDCQDPNRALDAELFQDHVTTALRL